MGDHANTAEVEPVGIPASTDGRILMMQAIGVPCAGIMEKCEKVICEMELAGVSQNTCKLGRTSTMGGIIAIILAAAVVEDRKQSNDIDVRASARRQEQAVALDAAPVVRAMKRVGRAGKLVREMLH